MSHRICSKVCCYLARAFSAADLDLVVLDNLSDRMNVYSSFGCFVEEINLERRLKAHTDICYFTNWNCVDVHIALFDAFSASFYRLRLLC